MKLGILFTTLTIVIFFNLHVQAAVPDDQRMEFVEQWVLSKDREETLRQLVPGTEDSYFYHALNYQQTGQSEKFKKTMTAWAQAFSIEENPFGTRRYVVLKNRGILLNYADDPDASIQQLKELLKLKLDHQRPIPPEDASIPSVLNPEQVSEHAFYEQSFAKNQEVYYRDLTGYLLREELKKASSFDRSKRLWFLKKPFKGDFPEIPQLVLAELQDPSEPSFKQVPGTNHLMLDQLLWLEKQHPALRDDKVFVYAVLSRMRPGNLYYFITHPKQKREWLESAWNYAQSLSPQFSSLKAHLLYNLLSENLKSDTYPEDLFINYIQLARPRVIAPRTERALANLHKEFYEITQLIDIFDDQGLVRTYLHHLLGKNKDTTAFRPYFSEAFLTHIQAESQLLAGGSVSEWGKKLTPEKFRELRDRTEVLLPPSNPPQWSASDSVTLQLDLKNTPDLSVRIFKIDALTHLLRDDDELDVEVKLNGLVPHHQETLHFKNPPLVRHRYQLKLPELTGRGVWVVECISKGVSCRTLIRKGELRLMPKNTAKGQIVTVVDEANRPVHPSTVWLKGKPYPTDQKGQVLLPFASSDRKETVIVSAAQSNDVPKAPASLAISAQIKRIQASYQLSLKGGTDREQLIAGKTATLIIRPRLRNNGICVPLKTLKNPTIHITAILTNEITTELSDITADLSGDDIILQKITVPEDTRVIEITLNGEVIHSGKLEPVQLTASSSMKINGINDKSKIAQPLLSKTTEGWEIELVGRNGEALPHRALECSFRHRGYFPRIKKMLRTDTNGRIKLGILPDIDRLKIDATEFSEALSVQLDDNDHNVDKSIHTLVGETIRLAHHSTLPEQQALSSYRLIRHNGDPELLLESMSSHLSLSDGELIIKDLPAGKYSLFSALTRHPSTTISVIDGIKNGPWLSDAGQTIEHSNPTPLYISTGKVKQGQLTAKVVGDPKTTHVLAIGTRYYHGTDSFHLLNLGGGISSVSWKHVYLGNKILNGRTLSDEYRYILERRQAKHFVGNMLPRPGLILYPWKKQDSDTLEPEPSTPQSGIPQCMRGRKFPSGGGSFGSGVAGGQSTTSFDFLAHPSVIQTKLTPAADGTITLDLHNFPHCQNITLIAYNNEQTASQLIPLSPKKRITRERRLDRNLDPTKHYTGTRATAILRKGATAEIKNVLDADWKAYTSLSHVYDYFYAQKKKSNLRAFAIMMDWPTLDQEQRLAVAQQLASHEFHLFVYAKDRKWFDANIKPVLANKRHRSFIDDFLLHNDLTPYLSPWRYQKLNAAEKALLAHAVPAQKEAIVDDLRNRYALRHPTPAQETILFASALKQNALAHRDRLGIAKGDLALLGEVDRSVSSSLYVQNVLDTIIIPVVDFEDITIEDALNFIHLVARQMAPDTAISFVLQDPSPQGGGKSISQRKIEKLKLRDVPVRALLQYICDSTRTRYRIREHDIVISPLASLELSDIQTRSFIVPPDFLANLSDSASDSGSDHDPFGSTDGKPLLALPSIKELLQTQGISFPDQSSVTFGPVTGTLVVRNTAANLDLIDQVTQALHMSGDSFDDSSVARAPLAEAPMNEGGNEGGDPFGDSSENKKDTLKSRPVSPRFLPEFDTLSTHIWSESHYYHHPNLKRQPVIRPNQFWIAYAAHSGDSPFLSARFTECTDSSASMLMALAVLDLPYSGEKPEAKINRLSLKVVAKSPMLLFYRDTRETKKVAKESTLLVQRRFFRIGDRTRRDERGREVENPMAGDFLVGVPYVTSFIITNPTGTPREIQVLTQIPRGSIPLLGQPATQARDLNVPAHSTQRVEYSFYFPSAGTYPHFPAHVLEHGVVQASASSPVNPTPLKVVDHAEKRDTRSWAALARDGSENEILTRLQSANLHRLPLSPILWRLSHKDFYQKVVQLLRSRLVFSSDVFAYGFLHGDTTAVTTYLENNAIAEQLGDFIDSPLLSVDLRERWHWEHLEYAPLVNPRQHAYQGKSFLSNRQSKKQYLRVLDAIRWKATPSQDDLLTLTYHLFLQDRIEEGLTQFANIRRDQTISKMQYDYLHCYTLFYQEKPSEAAVIASQWKNAPSPRWRKQFEQVILQASEIAQQKVLDPSSTPTTSTAPVARNLNLIPAKGGVTINYSGIKQVTLRLYSIDLEVLFSENPTLNHQGGPQPSIQPNKTIVVDLPKGKNHHTVKLPGELQFGNVLAMIEGGGFRRVLTLDSNAHHVTPNLLQKIITVTRTSDGSPVPRCYVKIYIETTDGKTLFFKDGYTDLRGRFPYESHSRISPHQIRRYAIFTSHPKLGSKITDGVF